MEGITVTEGQTEIKHNHSVSIEASEIKPCPFCGSTGEYSHETETCVFSRIRCSGKDCDASIANLITRDYEKVEAHIEIAEKTLKAWNTRVLVKRGE